MIKILIGVVLVTVAVIATFLVLDPNVGIQSVGTVTEVANTFTVTVEGEVYKTGTYTLNEGALMSDLLEAAGGTTDLGSVR